MEIFEYIRIFEYIGIFEYIRIFFLQYEYIRIRIRIEIALTNIFVFVFGPEKNIRSPLVHAPCTLFKPLVFLCICPTVFWPIPGVNFKLETSSF